MKRQNYLHVGIDFGTTNSTVAIMDKGRPRALRLERGGEAREVLKSLIYINPKGERAIGREAIKRYLWDIKNLEPKPPRLVATGRMIKTFGPSSGGGVGKVIMVPEIVEVDQSGRGRLLQSLKSALTSDTFIGTNIFDKFYTLEDLLGILMEEIKRRAEEETDGELKQVVLGRPVRYVGSGREQLALERMERVAKRAGFEEIVFEYEPVGAALNYGIDVKEKQKVLVFDFGGGTLDVCVVSFPEGKILAVAGRAIGGDLLNSIMVENKLLGHFGKGVIISGKMEMPRYFYNALTSWYRVTLLKTVKDLATLENLQIRADRRDLVGNLRNLIVGDYGYSFFERVDEAKVALSEADETTFNFELPEYMVEEKIRKDEFEKMIEEQLEETVGCMDEVIRGAGMTGNEIEKVLITGGSSKIPAFTKLLVEKFGREKLVLGNRFTCVGMGLAVRAGQLFG